MIAESLCPIPHTVSLWGVDGHDSLAFVLPTTCEYTWLEPIPTNLRRLYEAHLRTLWL